MQTYVPRPEVELTAVQPDGDVRYFVFPLDELPPENMAATPDELVARGIGREVEHNN